MSTLKPTTQQFVGLHGARLLASCHIVLGHLYQSGYVRGYFFAWGYCLELIERRDPSESGAMLLWT